jgi:hypothetical protein
MITSHNHYEYHAQVLDWWRVLTLGLACVRAESSHSLHSRIHNDLHLVGTTPRRVTTNMLEIPTMWQNCIHCECCQYSQIPISYLSLTFLQTQSSTLTNLIGVWVPQIYRVKALTALLSRSSASSPLPTFNAAIANVVNSIASANSSHGRIS